MTNCTFIFSFTNSTDRSNKLGGLDSKRQYENMSFSKNEVSEYAMDLVLSMLYPHIIGIFPTI